MGDAHARLQRPDGRGRPLSDEARTASAPSSKARARLPIRDAATLVVVKECDGPSRVLVGRRASGHVFMAGKLVFPGGRVDPADLKLAPFFELEEPVRERLMRRVGARFAPRRATALALAAIRETFEETGIMIGRRDSDFSSTLPVWSQFAAEGVAPDPAALLPVARAVTPPHQIRRFDTRFFVVRGETIARQVPFDQRPTDEFDRVSWMEFDEMLAEDLAPITRRIVEDLRQRASEQALFRPDVPMPCYRRGPGGFDCEFL